MSAPDLSRFRATVPEQLDALLEVGESIALHRDLSDLFADLTRRLRTSVHFDFISLILHDAPRNRMRLVILKSLEPTALPGPIELPVDGSVGGAVLNSQEPVVVTDVVSETRFPAGLALLREWNVRSVCVLPLTTAQRRIGAMGFGSREPRTYAPEEIEFLGRVARQVAVAVDRTLSHEAAEAYQAELIKERDRLGLLLEITNALVSELDLRELFRAISASLRRVMQCEYAALVLYEPEAHQTRLVALDFPSGKGLLHEELRVPLEESAAVGVIRSRRPLVLMRPEEFEQLPKRIREILHAEGLRSSCCLPLVTRRSEIGTLNVASRRKNAFSEDDVSFLSQVAAQVAIAVENALAYRGIEEQRNLLSEEKIYLEDEIRAELDSAEIIGDSPAWKRVLEQVATVARTDSTVLLLGETGTGKELLARAIHDLSGRRSRTFVKLNCAAIPTGLLESELFGHEKGAFTGAIARRIGRFELANRGTLFLDEVGEIPLEIQPKLLRVLQEQEFERLGNPQTVRVDVRLVAATNRDLAALVAGRGFRADLYYRLNIFPIAIPPLRERREDIPSLARYFTQKYSRRIHKRFESIAGDTLQAMQRYAWPGNVRELQNCIERAVVLSEGPVLRIRIAESNALQPEMSSSITLEAAEHRHILNVLLECGWQVAGPAGAAARLGLKRTTLQSKMQRLGIRRPRGIR